jgi:subtilisin family serine protease
MSDTSRSLPLPPVVFAQASTRSAGGTSLFESDRPITFDEVTSYESEADLVDRAASRLADAGFRVLQRTPLTINIAGPPALYEDYFHTNLVADEREVMRLGVIEGTATFVDAADTEISGLIDTSQSRVADIVEGVAIEEPAFRFQSAEPPMLDGYWHLDVPDQVAELLRADAAHELGFLGTGVRLAMVDSGWERHPYFVARGIDGTVVLGPGATDPAVDENGHGTGESANAFAVAPDITFTMVKANFANSVGAFNAAVALTPAPHVISNSWGYSVERRPLSAIHQALAASVAYAVANGIVVVFSAGNGHYGFPAQHPDVIAAGGVFIDPDGAMQASDYASGFASRIYPGRNVPDLCGLVGMRPRAMYIALPVPSGSELDVDLSNDNLPHPDGDGTTPDDGWAVFSGTSAACPQVAGICALIRQAAPDLPPAGVREALVRTATDVTEGRASPSTGAPAAGPGPDLATGAGFANAVEAVNTVLQDIEETIDLRSGSALDAGHGRRVPYDG